MQASKAPDTIDAESFASNLTLVRSLFPTMPEGSVRRASWAVAKSKMSLQAAVAAEGFALEGDACVAAPTASQIAELASLKAQIAALRGPSPASAAVVNFPAGADHAGTFPPGYDARSLAAHRAAMRLMNVCRGMRYNAALAAVSRWTK